MPTRIQMTRQRPWRHEHPDAVIVDRTTRWGNPYRVGDTHPSRGIGEPITREESVRLYRRAIARGGAVLVLPDQTHASIPTPSVEEIRAELAGRDLACWCPLPAPGEPDICHAAVLLEIANGGAS